MMEGSGAGSVPVILTNGSGSGSGRPKNIWIPNTGTCGITNYFPIVKIRGTESGGVEGDRHIVMPKFNGGGGGGGGAGK